MHNQEPILVNETHKLLSDFNIPIDQLISARRPDRVTVKKKKMRERLLNSENWRPGRPQGKIEINQKVR